MIEKIKFKHLLWCLFTVMSGHALIGNYKILEEVCF